MNMIKNTSFRLLITISLNMLTHIYSAEKSNSFEPSMPLSAHITGMLNNTIWIRAEKPILSGSTVQYSTVY